MATTLIIPGLHSSDHGHWQSWFEERIPGSVRVIQRDWNDANLPDWSSRVRREINRIPGRHFLVAHSFGVLAAVQAATDHADRIAGALLVAPADPHKFGVADYIPGSALPFRTVVVGSTSDPWMSLDRVAHWADVWGADLVNLGDAGHINTSAGFGPWPEGLALLERLRRAPKPYLVTETDSQGAARVRTRARVRVRRAVRGTNEADEAFDRRALELRLASAI